jgi:hypothetical protein
MSVKLHSQTKSYQNKNENKELRETRQFMLDKIQELEKTINEV